MVVKYHGISHEKNVKIKIVNIIVEDIRISFENVYFS
jgi:hypothetical protein